jgi:hypothetical protein
MCKRNKEIVDPLLLHCEVASVSECYFSAVLVVLSYATFLLVGESVAV